MPITLFPRRIRHPLALATIGATIGAMTALAALPTATAWSADAPVVMHKMGEDIDIADAPGGARLETMGGNIHLGHVAGQAYLATMGGDLRLDTATGAVDVSSKGGDVTIGQVAGPLFVKTSGGDTSVTTASGSVSVTSAGGNISVGLHPEETPRTVTLSALGGDITLHVPHDFNGTIDARLAFSRQNEGRYHIEEPFALKQTVSPDWDNSHGQPYKTIQATGTIGQGRDHVSLSTVDADIRIIRD